MGISDPYSSRSGTFLVYLWFDKWNEKFYRAVMSWSCDHRKPTNMFSHRAFVKRNQELYCFIFHLPVISSNINLFTNISVDQLLVNVITLQIYFCISFIFVSEIIKFWANLMDVKNAIDSHLHWIRRKNILITAEYPAIYLHLNEWQLHPLFLELFYTKGQG